MHIQIVRDNIFVSNNKGACRSCKGDITHAQYTVGKAEAALVVEILMPNPILLFLFLSRTNWIINRLSFFFQTGKKNPQGSLTLSLAQKD